MKNVHHKFLRDLDLQVTCCVWPKLFCFLFHKTNTAKKPVQNERPVKWLIVSINKPSVFKLERLQEDCKDDRSMDEFTVCVCVHVYKRVYLYLYRVMRFLESEDI